MKAIIFGHKGQLGREFIELCNTKNIQALGFDLPEFNITDISAVEKLITQSLPDIVINCAAYNDVDRAESDFANAYNTNANAVRNIAQIANRLNILTVHFSSDYVFDGKKGQLYLEDDMPNPVNSYGESKLSGETLLREVCDNYLIFRLSWVYGRGNSNFIHKFLSWTGNKATIEIADDEISVPTSARLVASIALNAIQNNLCGTYHLVNSGSASRYQWASKISEILKKNLKIIPCSKSKFKLPARRPDNSSMNNSKIQNELNIQIPEWDNSLEEFLKSDY